MNINAAVQLEIKEFAGPTITRLESGLYNSLIDISKGKPVVTQRPGIDIFEQADAVDDRGRAIYHWDSNDTLYILNNDTIYKNTYSSSIATTITAGVTRCKFLQLGTYLILLNADDNKGYTITTGDVVTQIASSFPSTLAYGGAILDGYLFVMDEDGIIYNSNLDDPTTFTSGDTINAEREEDGGVYLGKHNDHIVAFGQRTIEFYYDAANATNSPLSRREDISYNLGCISGESVWESGDLTIFLGVDISGSIGVFTLNKFLITKISTSSLDALLSQAILRDSYNVTASGFAAQGHQFYVLTFHHTDTDIVPDASYVYDFTAQAWYEWETSIGTNTYFPVVDWTIRSGDVRYGQGIMINGDVIIVNNDYSPQDTIGAQVYVTPATYVDFGYITDSSASGSAFTMRIRFGQFDGDTNKNKFMHNLRPRMSKTTDSQTMTVKWSDDNEDNFITAGTFDTIFQNKYIRRCGRFNRRNIEIEYSGTEQLWVESLEFDVELSTV